MSTTVTVSVKSPSATIIVSAGSSTLQVAANGQVIWSSSNPPSSPPEVPQGATLTFSGTATDSGGHPFANTVFYFFTQGPIPSSGSAPSPTSQSVTTDSSGVSRCRHRLCKQVATTSGLTLTHLAHRRSEAWLRVQSST